VPVSPGGDIGRAAATEMYQPPAGQRGSSPQRYERFLAGTWPRLLLAD
jgi:hypothetical protein